MAVLFERLALPETELQAFYEAFQAEPVKGILLNRQKLKQTRLTVTDIWQILQLNVSPVPGHPDGFFWHRNQTVDKTSAIAQIPSPTQSPLYLAGAYYIQDPAAMLPVLAMAVQPSDCVLDLCAAPGGKTAGIAQFLGDEGCLMSNEVDVKRNAILVHQVEQLGLSTVFVTRASAAALAQSLPAQFDKILLDAPCSGESLFRRQKDAVSQWERFGPKACVPVQKELLHWAWQMLKPGGVLVYSTCTFSLPENEGVIRQFLDEHETAILLPMPPVLREQPDLVVRTLPEVLQEADLPVRYAGDSLRALPHRFNGEGQTCFRLTKVSGDCLPTTSCQRADHAIHVSAERWPSRQGSGGKKKLPHKRAKETASQARICPARIIPYVQDFFQQLLKPDWYAAIADQLLQLTVTQNGYLNLTQSFSWVGLAENPPAVDKLLQGIPQMYVRKFPVFLGQVITRGSSLQFKPSDALLRFIPSAAFMNPILLSHADDQLDQYLKGETLCIEQAAEKAVWRPVLVDDLPLGWGKQVGHQLKNYCPRAYLKKGGL